MIAFYSSDDLSLIGTVSVEDGNLVPSNSDVASFSKGRDPNEFMDYYKDGYANEAYIATSIADGSEAPEMYQDPNPEEVGKTYTWTPEEYKASFEKLYGKSGDNN